VKLDWTAPGWRWVALALAVAGGAAMLWSAYARKRALARFGDPALVSQLRDGSTAGWRTARGVMVLVALALVGLAAARPVGNARTELVARRGIDIVVCLDVSKSMLARDVRPSRIERARNELRRLLQEEPGDRVGIVVFAGATMEYPLTTDHESAERFMREVEPWNFPVGGTSIGRAITAATQLFARDPLAPRRSKVIIVLTDGEDLDGDPVEAARAANRAGIQVFLDAIGSTVPEPIPQYDAEGRVAGFMRDPHTGQVVTTAFTPEMETQLRAVAEAGHGRYFRAHAGEVGIEAVRREIAGLRRAEIAATQQTVTDTRMALFVLPAFILLVLASTLVPERIVRRRAGAGGGDSAAPPREKIYRGGGTPR
jgi:Ca-activated chloride channel family protein